MRTCNSRPEVKERGSRVVGLNLSEHPLSKSVVVVQRPGEGAVLDVAGTPTRRAL